MSQLYILHVLLNMFNIIHTQWLRETTRLALLHPFLQKKQNTDPKVCHSSKTKNITYMKRLSCIYSVLNTIQNKGGLKRSYYIGKLIYLLILSPTELHIPASAVNTTDLLQHITDNFSCRDITLQLVFTKIGSNWPSASVRCHGMHCKCKTHY